MKKALLLTGLLLLNNACSTRVLKPAMELTLIDRVSKQALNDAMNTKQINLDKSSKLILKRIVEKQVPSPSGVHYIISVLAIAPKGYKPQWCLCQILNISDKTCQARAVEFTAQQKSKNMTKKALDSWLKKESRNIQVMAELFKKYDYPNPTPIFCSEDPLFIKR